MWTRLLRHNESRNHGKDLMIEANLSSRQKCLLKKFTDAGGVVDYVFFDCDVAIEPVQAEQTHRQAVIRGLEVLQRRAEEYADHESKRLNISREQFFRPHIDYSLTERLTGKQLSRAEFLGSRYDLRRNGLIVHGGKEPFLNEFLFYLDNAKSENVIPFSQIDNGIGTGYAYAFSDPPYQLRLLAKDKGRIFATINSNLLGGIDDTSVIYEWPTDWTDYFDAGKEWWGSFLWSFANHALSRVVIIAASATD